MTSRQMDKEIAELLGQEIPKGYSYNPETESWEAWMPVTYEDGSFSRELTMEIWPPHYSTCFYLVNYFFQDLIEFGTAQQFGIKTENPIGGEGILHSASLVYFNKNKKMQYIVECGLTTEEAAAKVLLNYLKYSNEDVHHDSG
jgi:hypothetical protein